jgi:mannose-6-phosphate isomerase-like protein (cupin superfamily)
MVDRTMERIERPWGWYETLATGDGYLVKRLWIAPDQRISLQRHSHRSEHWFVAFGEGLVTLNNQQLVAPLGSTFEVPKGAIHRAEAGREGMTIVEIQRGSKLIESDIERFADDYGRCPTQPG